MRFMIVVLLLIWLNAIEVGVSEGYEGGGDEEGFCFHVTRLSG